MHFERDRTTQSAIGIKSRTATTRPKIKKKKKPFKKETKKRVKKITIQEALFRHSIKLIPVFLSSMAGILAMMSTTSPVSLAAPISPPPPETTLILSQFIIGAAHSAASLGSTSRIMETL